MSRPVRGRRMDWRITLDDGRDVTATSDQRDWAAWEAAELSGAITALRFLAWSAAKRGGAYRGTFQEFNTRDCVEVQDITEYPDEPADDDGEGEQRLDPGRPAPHAGT